MLAMLLAFLMFGLLASITFGLGAAGRPRVGARDGWLVSLCLMPMWMGYQFGSAYLFPQTFAALCGVASLWLFPRPFVQGAWGRTGVLLGLYVASISFSEYRVGELRPLVIPSYLVSYVIPFYLGLTFFDRKSDLVDASAVMGRCVAAVTLYACVECVTRVNIVSSLTRAEHWAFAGDGGYRYGLKRAMALADHPITFGYLIQLVLPWLLIASRREVDGPRPPWWRRNLMALAMVASVASLSRGAILGYSLWLAILGIFRSPRLRYPILAALVTAALVMTFAQEQILDALLAVTGSEEAPTYIMIDGKPELYDGTRHRLLLSRVYAPVMDESASFGHGASMKYVSLKHYNIPDVFWSVDNHYVLERLHYGWAGLSLLVLTFLNATVVYIRLAMRASEPIALFSGGVAASLILTFNVMQSVSLGAVPLAILFFYCGLAQNLRKIEYAELA